MPQFTSQHLDNSHTTQVECIGDYVYVGIAKIGTTRSEPMWSIKRVDTGPTITVLWADGNADFDKVMDNYATYPYS